MFLTAAVSFVDGHMGAVVDEKRTVDYIADGAHVTNFVVVVVVFEFLNLEKRSASTVTG